MELETAEQPYSIRIPLTDSDQCIELFVDELSDNTDELTQTLFGENVHPHYWIQIAVGYYSVKKYPQFLKIIDTILQEENFKRFEQEYECKLVLLNYRAAYKLKTNTLTADEYRQYDFDSNVLINMEQQDRTASATALALKCIYCLRTDDMKAAYTYMVHALDRDRSCLLSSVAAALYFIQNRDYAKAINAYRMALLYHPDAPASIRVGVAYCFYQQGNYKKAFLALERALQLDPRNEEALGMKAALQRTSPDLSAKERVILSMQTIQQLYYVNQSNPQALNYIADHTFWQWSAVEGLVATVEQNSDTVKVTGDVSKLHSAQPIRINGILCRIRSAREASATGFISLSVPYTGASCENVPIEIRETAKCLELATRSAEKAKMSSLRSEAWELMGRCYHADNYWSKAEKFFSRAVNANKRNIIAQYGLAQVSIHLSSQASTRQEKEQLRNKARSYLSTCMQFGCTSYEVTFLSAYLLYKSNDLQRALTTVSTLPEKKGLVTLRTLLHTLLLKAQLLQGNFLNPDELDKARLLYEQYVNLSLESGTPFAPLVWNNVAILRRARSGLSSAQLAMDEVLRHALRQKQLDDQPRSLLTLNAEALHQFLEDPLNVTLLFNYAMLLDEAGESDHARDLWEKILKEVPQYYDCILCIAKQEIRTGHIAEAEARLRELSTELDTQLRAGFLKESSTLLGYVINSYTDTLCLIARILAEQHKEKEAIDMILHSFISKSRHPDLYVNTLLISLYLRLANHDSSSTYMKQATEMIKRAITKQPSNVYLASASGALLQQTGKPRDALYIFKKVRESALTLQNTCLNVASLSLREGRFNDAACLYKAVLTQGCTDEVNVRLCLALARMKSGGYTDALEELSRALQINPSDLCIWYNMAVCHVSLARSVLSNVIYTHKQVFNEATQRYPCCNGARNDRGCHMRSLRNPGDLARAEISIQFAINTLLSLKNSADEAWDEERVSDQQIEEMLIQCRTLWEEREKQKQLDEQQMEQQTKTAKTNEDVQLLLEQRRQEELKVEREKREQQQRIEQIAAEEKTRIQDMMRIINEAEIQREEKSARSRKTKRTRAKGRNDHAGSRNKVVESSDEESDDNGPMSEDDVKEGLRDVFGDSSESESESEEKEKEEKKEPTKKRVRTVESSEDETEQQQEEKRARLEELQREVDNVFSDED